MLTCCLELPRKSLVAFAVLLQFSRYAAGISERKVVAVGSSVLLPAPDNIKDIRLIHWEYTNGSMSLCIVQYSEGSLDPTVYEPYRDRVNLHPSNGSLLIKNVQETDSGIYEAAVNLTEMKARKTILEVLMPVSQPHIRRKTVPEEAASKLFCDVAGGRVDTIDWKKDGKPLPEDQDFQLSQSHSILIISEAQKLNCGSYSCNVSNEISWQETTLNWAIAGTSPPQPVVLRMSVTALAFAAVSGLALIAPCCQSEKLRIRGELWRWLSVYTHGLLCVSSTLAFTAAGLWMREEGPSASFIVPEILLTYVIIVTFLVSAAMTIQPAKLNGLKSITTQHTLDYIVPGGVFLVVLTASFLIKKIQQLHEKACTEFVDITALTVSTAVVSFLPLLAILVCYHITQRWQKESSNSRRQDLQETL